MTSLRKIDVFIFDNVNIVDIAGPVQAFNCAMNDGNTLYKHQFLSLDGKPVKTSCGLELSAQGKLEDHQTANDLMIPGGDGVDTLLENISLQKVISDHIKKHHSSRLISICSGSLLLASSGVLNGKAATTHWKRSKMVHEKFPEVAWTLNTIYTVSERIYTSAGVTTGIDLALAIIEKDFGAECSLSVAKEMVVYLRRTGGQSQFSDLLDTQYGLEGSLLKLLETIKDNLTRNWTLEQLALETNMSTRSLTRKLKDSLNIPPVQFVERIRLDHARTLLSNGVKIKLAAAESGFGSVQRMRRSFKRNLDMNISEYLERFGPEN